MYQGKFEKKKETPVQNVPADDLLTPPAEEIPQPSAGDTMRLLEERAAQRRNTPKPKPRSKVGSIVFYSIYAVIILAIVVGVSLILPPLEDWLNRYEASQPKYKAEEVFQELFANPDWADLYTRAGMKDTVYENADTYAAYMKEKVGSQKLTYLETSAGLSGDHKYIVSLGNEKVATFRLTGGTNNQTDISVWELSTVEVFFERTRDVYIEKHPDYTIYLNGVALDDSHLIRTVTTKAEALLPEGLHGYRMEQMYAEGFLMEPIVTATDADGNPVTVIYSAQTGYYVAQQPAPAEITDAIHQLALDTAKADAAYSVRRITESALAKYFDRNSQVYTDIVTTWPFLQSFQTYSFDDSQNQVSQYYRYSDSLYSVHVKVHMRVLRSDGTIKEVPLSKTYFYTKMSDGSFKVTQYTNAPIQDPVEQVRIRFMANGEMVASMMVDSQANTLTLPPVQAPAGQILKGWAIQETDENGKITMTILYTPTENGVVNTNGTLVPTTLYAVFAAEEAPSEPTQEPTVAPTEEKVA